MTIDRSRGVQMVGCKVGVQTLWIGLLCAIMLRSSDAIPDMRSRVQKQ